MKLVSSHMSLDGECNVKPLHLKGLLGRRFYFQWLLPHGVTHVLLGTLVPKGLHQNFAYLQFLRRALGATRGEPLTQKNFGLSQGRGFSSQVAWMAEIVPFWNIFGATTF